MVPTARRYELRISKSSSMTSSSNGLRSSSRQAPRRAQETGETGGNRKAALLDDALNCGIGRPRIVRHPTDTVDRAVQRCTAQPCRTLVDRATALAKVSIARDGSFEGRSCRFIGDQAPETRRILACLHRSPGAGTPDQTT